MFAPCDTAMVRDFQASGNLLYGYLCLRSDNFYVFSELSTDCRLCNWLEFLGGSG